MLMILLFGSYHLNVYHHDPTYDVYPSYATAHVYLLPIVSLNEFIDFISHMCICAYVYLLPIAYCHMWMNLLVSISCVCIYVPVYLLPITTS